MNKLILSGCIFLFALFVHSSAASLPRKVLAEMFTSTTCAPCYPADNFYFNQWLPNYGGASQIITLAYHVWWPPPGDDPMFLANQPPVQTRRNYYFAATAFSPYMFVDGFIDAGGGYSSWPGAIEPRFLDSSPISITLSGTKSGNTLNMNASIYAASAVNSTNWRLQWVVVENEISQPQWNGTSYVPFTHRWVHRGMYPDANGSAISISQGQTVNVQRQITVAGGWVANNCKVIVFVQDNTNKKVQNAEVIDVADIVTGVGQNAAGTPADFVLDQNYPNPFNPTTNISYGLNERSFVSLKIYNLLGEQVRSLVSQDMEAGYHDVKWDGRGNDGLEAPTGMYIYQMTAGKFSETRKMLLLK